MMNFTRPTIADRGVVFMDAPGSESASATFPSVCALPAGRWLCAFRAAPRKKDSLPQRVLLTWSDDAGRTWQPPIEPFRAPPINDKPGSFRMTALTALGGSRVVAVLYWVDASDPTKPFYNEATEGLLESRIVMARSEDGGETWTTPWRVETRPFTTPTPITGPLLLLGNGEWALQFETNKDYDDPSPWVHSSVLMFSRDEGKSWPEHVKVSEDPTGRFFYWDQRPVVLPDGGMADFFWTFDRGATAYRCLHLRTSSDHGRTWTPLRDIGVPGQAGTPVGMPDGRILLPYMDRTQAPLLKVRVSPDRGRSWPEETEIVVDDSVSRHQQKARATMQETWADMSRFSVGYPSAAPLSEREVLLVYYAGLTADHTGIQWVRLRM